MQFYQFERIFSQMEKEFGKVRRGEENDYDMLFFPLESNVLKVHRAFPSSNSRRLRALLMAFDPYTNPEAMEALGQQGKMAEVPPEKLKSYYKIPIMCLLRIKESVDTWEKQGGADGYFDFTEDFLGSHVKGDKMEVTVMNPEALKP